MSNLFIYENHFRLISGMMMLIYAAHNQAWLLGLIGIFMIYTGAIHFCPVFYTLGINRDRARHRYHLSLLPGHNPEPVYLFDKHGDLVFRNDAAKDILPNLRSMQALQQENEMTGFQSTRKLSIAGFREGAKSYLLNYKPIKDSGLIAAYGFNVTELMQANEEIVNTQKELLYRMGEIGETRSKETGNHVKRVAEYSKQLALLVGLDTSEAETLKMASPMHDIGKVAIPDSVLLKPGKLNAQEWEIMKSHATIG